MSGTVWGRERSKTQGLGNQGHVSPTSRFGQGPPRTASRLHFGKFHQLGGEVFFRDVIINCLIKTLCQSIYWALWREMVTAQVNTFWLCRSRSVFSHFVGSVVKSEKYSSCKSVCCPKPWRATVIIILFCLGFLYKSAWAWHLVLNHLSMEQ